MAQDAIRLITTALPRGRPIPAASHAFPGVEPAHSNPTIDACDVRQAHGRGAGIARLPRQPGLSYGRVRWTTVTKHPTDSMKPRPNCRCMWIRSGGGCGKGGSRWSGPVRSDGFFARSCWPWSPNGSLRAGDHRWAGVPVWCDTVGTARSASSRNRRDVPSLSASRHTRGRQSSTPPCTAWTASTGSRTSMSGRSFVPILPGHFRIAAMPRQTLAIPSSGGPRTGSISSGGAWICLAGH